MPTEIKTINYPVLTGLKLPGNLRAILFWIEKRAWHSVDSCGYLPLQRYNPQLAGISMDFRNATWNFDKCYEGEHSSSIAREPRDENAQLQG
jgi:hypothetical protein